MGNNNSKGAVAAVLSGFFVMGFCDVVGISVSYAKTDFGLTETMAGLIPSMVFVWFFLLSVPIAGIMNRIGRKKTVLASYAITIAGMAIPLVSYSFAGCMAAFILLGIGNTILQVSLNPLLADVAGKERATSMLTGGQVIKAVSSFCGPFIAAGAAAMLGSWKYIFPIFALITVLSTVWLVSYPVAESGGTSRGGGLRLLADKKILLMFLGIFFVVGVDVGTNTAAPKLLMERCGLPVERAGLGSSVYFVCRTFGALLGAFILARMDEVRYMRVNLVAAALCVGGLAVAGNEMLVYVLLGGTGFFCAGIFPVIFSMALRQRPDCSDEVSGLMIMGVAGGAVIPPAMGAATDLAGSQIGSVAVIGVCLAYLIVFSFIVAAGKSIKFS